VPRLREQLSAALDEEFTSRWRADAAAVKAKTEAASASVAAVYGEFATKMVEALRAATGINSEVDRLNGAASEHRLPERLAKVDLTWAQNLRLPDPADRNHDLWLPPQTPFAVQFVQCPTRSATTSITNGRPSLSSLMPRVQACEQVRAAIARARPSAGSTRPRSSCPTATDHPVDLSVSALCALATLRM
jgi:hypothetical protein